MKKPIIKKIHDIKSKLGNIQLLVVTKKRSVDEIREVIASGVKDIGENKLQEIQRKYDINLLQELKKKGVRLHFLGNLQTNKITKIVKLCDVIQSVGSSEKAKKIQISAEKIGKKLSIFIQINIATEEQKGGIMPDESLKNLKDLVAEIQKMKNLELKGFMSIGIKGDKVKTRIIFKKCKDLVDLFGLKQVSMGMSNDYQIAIEEKSTIVRIGSMIFCH